MLSGDIISHVDSEGVECISIQPLLTTTNLAKEDSVMANKNISRNKITKQEIEKIYHKEKLTTRELAKRLNFSYGHTNWLLKKYSIQANRPNRFQKGVKQNFHKKGRDSSGWKGGKIKSKILRTAV